LADFSLLQVCCQSDAPAASVPVQIPPGIIGWWRGEASASDSFGTNDGTFTGEYAPGFVGQSFRFYAVGPRAVVPNAAELNPTNGLALEAWVKIARFSTIGDAVALVTKDDPYGLRQYSLSMGNTSGPWRFRALVGASSGIGFCEGATTVQLDQWYHVALTHDGSVLRLFVNGQLDATTAALGKINVSDESLVIGGHDGGPWNMDGWIDEVSVYSRSLSEGEIASIYAAGQSGKSPTASCVQAPQGIVSWWSGEDDAADSIGLNFGHYVGSVGFAAGKVGKSFAFTNGYVEVPSSPSLNLSNAATVELWYRDAGTIDRVYGLLAKRGPFLDSRCNYGESLPGSTPVLLWRRGPWCALQTLLGTPAFLRRLPPCSSHFSTGLR
jgi:hypothetical protein